MRRLAVIGMGTIALCASCSLLVTTDSLSGGESSLAGDASTDAPAGDRDSALDSAIDGTTGDGAATRFCEDKKDARLCDDFDLGALPGAFANQEAQGTVVSRSPDGPLSSPFALQIAVAPEGSATVAHFGGLHTQFTSQTGAMTIDFAIRILKAPSNEAFISGVALELQDAQLKSVYDVELRIDAKGGAPAISMVDYTNATNTMGPPTGPVAVSLGGWTTLRMDVDFVAKKAELFRGADLIGSLALTSPVGVPLPPPATRLYLGVFAYGQQDGWTIQYDDVAIHSR